VISNHKLLTLTATAAFSILTTLQAFGFPETKYGIADTIKADVAQIVSGINAHDVELATRFDADDIVSMESGRPPSQGIAAERAGLTQAFHYAPSWRLQLIEENVDVARSGEMAVYRSTYNEESIENGVPMTHRVNFLAEFKRNPKGAFQVIWSVVSSIEKSHKK
jgi:ketosteroid isomerase-like protein